MKKINKRVIEIENSNKQQKFSLIHRLDEIQANLFSLFIIYAVFIVICLSIFVVYWSFRITECKIPLTH